MIHGGTKRSLKQHRVHKRGSYRDSGKPAGKNRFQRKAMDRGRLGTYRHQHGEAQATTSLGELLRSALEASETAENRSGEQSTRPQDSGLGKD